MSGDINKQQQIVQEEEVKILNIHTKHLKRIMCYNFRKSQPLWGNFHKPFGTKQCQIVCVDLPQRNTARVTENI